MFSQFEISLRPMSRGFHLITADIVRQLPKLPKVGLINIFTKHTSCGLSINENCDPDVRIDMETIFNRLVPENRPDYEHTLEGPDDMPAHAKAVISGVRFLSPMDVSISELGRESISENTATTVAPENWSSRLWASNIRFLN